MFFYMNKLLSYELDLLKHPLVAINFTNLFFDIINSRLLLLIKKKLALIKIGSINLIKRKLIAVADYINLVLLSPYPKSITILFAVSLNLWEF